MTRVGLTFREYTVREPNPNDNWDIGDRDGSVEQVFIADGNQYNWSYRDHETELEPPFYVVYAEYYTGCTFGTSAEADIITVVKTAEEADVIVEKATAAKKYDIEGLDYHVPWNGYFESLKSVRYERLS
jgi:hypothetical protein